MNSSKTDIDNWLIETSTDNNDAQYEAWEPIFNADLQLVQTKIGPYTKLFLRPEGFTKRFYHTVYPLPVETWRVTHQVMLYDSFCNIDVRLDIQFQATLKYARSNIEVLSNINEHIKNAYYDLLVNLVHKELLELSDDHTWVQKGLNSVEKKISLKVSEMLILQSIQSLTLCTLKPLFAEFPEVKLGKDRVYLGVLKKSFEFNEIKRQELFRHEHKTEKQTQEQKQKLLNELNHEIELDRLKQSQEALNKRLLLEEQEKHLLEQNEIEKRLYAEKLKHENILKEMTLAAEIEARQKQEARLKIAEQQAQMELLEQQARLKDQELEADIAQYEKEQARWRDSKNKAFSQQLNQERRQKQLEFEFQVENQKRSEKQQLAIKKDRYKKRLATDDELRREIESLELEKQRLELQLAINDTKMQDDVNSDLHDFS